MQNTTHRDTFHFFGDVYLQEPNTFLDKEQSEVFQKFMPLIQEFALRQGKPMKRDMDWDMDSRYQELVRQENEAWRELGVIRQNPSEFLVRPSGSIDAPMALHLVNPTFYVSDPHDTETFDTSSPTMALLQEQGFSPDNSFIFDQFCRRSRTEDCLYFCTEDIHKPHDKFVCELRKNMSAIIEVCCGDLPWQKLKSSCELVKFPLWGRLRDVELFLEIEEGRIRRFIFPVRHPQYFFRPRRERSDTRSSEALIQDSTLWIASRLAGFSVREKFYEGYSKLEFPRLRDNALRKSKLLQAKFLEEIKIAFPARYEEWQGRVPTRRYQQQPLKDLLMVLAEIEGDDSLLGDDQQQRQLESSTSGDSKAVETCMELNERQYYLKPRSPKWAYADWSNFFCRRKNEVESLPKSVQTKCKTCNAPSVDDWPRWTIELIPRYVIPVRQCQSCLKKSSRKKCSFFYPVLSGQEKLHSSILTRRWKRISDANFNPNDYPNLRAKIFGKTDISGIVTAVMQTRARLQEKVKEEK